MLTSSLVAASQPPPQPTTTPLLEALKAEKSAQKDKEAILRAHAHYKDPSVAASAKKDDKKKGAAKPASTEQSLGKKAKKAAEGDEMDVDDQEGVEKEAKGAASLLSDPRFKDLFENPEFEVDQQSREFALLNPSTVAQRQNRLDASGRRGKTKTAVEEEEEEKSKEDKPTSKEASDSADQVDPNISLESDIEDVEKALQQD